MTSLERRLSKLEARWTDESGLAPLSEQWLDYWQRWIDRRANDPGFRPRERMPIEAARAILAGTPDSE